MILFILLILCSVGYFTLLERKVLSLSQIRLGPNKTLLMGLIQPILDGVKLMKKNNITNLKIQNLIFFMISFFIFLTSFFMWMTIPIYIWENKSYPMMWMFFIFGINVFTLLFMGWSSMNKYSMMGGVRSLNQILSFEVLFSLMMMIICFMTYSLNLMLNFKILNFPLIIIFFILMVMEVQRTPMDLSEGESELVSGYNVEYGSILFVLVFLGEYTMMLFFIVLFCILWMKISIFSMMILIFLMLLLRSSFPRIRFDQLMNFSWMILLPEIMLMWIFYSMIVC